MMILIKDDKGYEHLFNPDYLKEVEFTKGAMCVKFKDERQDELKLKAKVIRFS